MAAGWRVAPLGLLLLGVVLTWAGPVAAESALVTEVDHTTFDAFIAEHERVLFKFYAPWCSVCKKLKPELERAAELLAESDLGVVVGRADVNKDEVLRDRFDVQRTPKFMVFTNGEPEPFLTYKSGEAMFSKLHSDLRPESGVQHSPAKTFTDMSELASWLFWRGTDGGRLEAAAVLFTPSDEVLKESPGAAATTQALRESFTTVAVDMVTKMRYAEVRSDEVLKLFEMPKDRATVAMYTEHDEGKHIYDGPARDVRRLQSFLLERLSPMVTDVDHVSLNKVSRATPLLMHLFVTEQEVETPALHRAVVNQAGALAQHLLASGVFSRGEFTIGITNGEKYFEWLRPFELPKSVPLPVLAINHISAGKLYAGPQNAFDAVPTDAGRSADADAPELAWAFNLQAAAHFINGASLGVVPAVNDGGEL